MGAIETLHNRIDLTNIPFSERGSRLLLCSRENTLYIRLAERWIKHETRVGHYRQRLPIVDRISFLDSAGQPLPFTLDTYPHLIGVETACGRFEWTYLDTETYLIRLPAGRCGISMLVYAEQPTTDRRGGVLRGVRNCAYTTNAHIIQNEIEAVAESRFRVTLLFEAQEHDALVLNITPRLGFNRSVPNAAPVISAARERWQEWFEQVPPVLDEYAAEYYYAWWVMRAGLMNTRYYFTREAIAPSKIHYVGVWHWDQFFHALAYRHVDTKLAEDQIRILIDHQQPNGMFPDAIHDEGLITHLEKPVDADVTKPPLMAWTALKLYEKSGHLDFLQEIYEPLARWHQWWVDENRDEATGLFIYRHPFSSGLDDSPLWDYGMPVVAPDLNAYLCNQLESLAQIAALIGEDAAAQQHRAEARALLEQMLRVMWDEQAGVFHALSNGKRVPVLTPFHLLPLWNSMLPEAITKRLIARLTDPETFWTRYPLPTVAINDPAFDPLQMWRGPTWVNINYLFVEALHQAERHDLAGELRRRTLELVMQHDDIYEYYHPITGERPPKAAPIFGWTSALFIDLAIQETQAREEMG